MDPSIAKPHSFVIFQMATAQTKGKGMSLSQILVNVFDFMRAIFGLRVVVGTKNGKVKVPILQRVLALVWCGLFAFSLFSSEKPDSPKSPVNVDLKNSLIVSILPKINEIASMLAFACTYILTQGFANKRKLIVEEIMQMYPTLSRKHVNRHPKGTNVVIAVGLIQTVYTLYWHCTKGKLSNSIYAFIRTTVPKLVSACFLVDYVSGVVIVLQEYVIINEELKDMRKRSLDSRVYPKDERVFQRRIMELAERHKILKKIGLQMNEIYSIQLLLNLSVIYAFIVNSSYIGLYTLIGWFKGHPSASLAIDSIYYLLFNLLTLGLVAEITSQLCEEVSETVDLFKQQQNSGFRQTIQKYFCWVSAFQAETKQL